MAGSSSMPSLPPPCPKSPPDYPDLYGKRRGAAKVQMLEREIGFLEEELKSIEGLQHASRCCKEVVDFVVANSDPLIRTNSKSRKSCRFWKWLCGWSCFNFSWICCCPRCSLHLEMPDCCDCNCNPSVVHLSAVLVSAVHVSAVHVSVANASAVHVSALHVLAVYDPNGAVAVVHYQNVGVALGLVLTALTALKRCHAIDIVAFFNVLHAQIVLAAAGDAALVLNVQRSSVVNGYGTFLRA
ncbi:hypothetical protein PVL29_013915 [Vitis rotundifolia]|uniref:G protein gamma domain-containing protein n=1 Tax=Vitis rotundifolia TaxID=103349 RepID=A0AA38ZFI8_VITRO|nr:hypothetical protein PVL29_013915 [Vitis rotundifolia]